MSNQTLDEWTEKFRKKVDKRNLEALLRLEEIIHPIAVDHWDMTACMCDVCCIRREISLRLVGREALFEQTLKELLENKEIELLYKYKVTNE